MHVHIGIYDYENKTMRSSRSNNSSSTIDTFVSGLPENSQIFCRVPTATLQQVQLSNFTSVQTLVSHNHMQMSQIASMSTSSPSLLPSAAAAESGVSAAGADAAVGLVAADFPPSVYTT